MTRVLLLAEAANPEWVSVPLIGWSLSRALADIADVHLVTQVRNREAILRAGLVEGKDFTAIDTERVTRPIWKIGEVLSGGSNRGWTVKAAINRFSYPWFEKFAWRHFESELKKGQYDLVHRITPVSPAIISPIATKLDGIGVPFVLGPLNGGVPWPKGFEAERRAEGERLSAFRNIYRGLPGRRKMLSASSAVLVATQIAEKELPSDVSVRAIRLPENAIDPNRFSLSGRGKRQPGPLRAVFVGRLVPLKGVDMLIEAAKSLLADGQMTLEIIGEGPMRGGLEGQVQSLSLGNAVSFRGSVPHETVKSHMRRADILTFPSIREFGGGVVLEAMAEGAVPIVVDYAGPGELVAPDYGWKVALGSKAEIIDGFRDILTKLAADPSVLEAKSLLCQEKIDEKFTWPARAKQIKEIWDWTLGRQPNKPQFF